jgi:hypothetical protein
VIAKLTRAGSTFLVESYSAAATRDAAVQGDRLRRACAELRAAGLDVDYVGALAVPQDELVLHVVRRPSCRVFQDARGQAPARSWRRPTQGCRPDLSASGSWPWHSQFPQRVSPDSLRGYRRRGRLGGLSSGDDTSALLSHRRSPSEVNALRQSIGG